MRLKPPPSADAVLTALTVNAVLAYGTAEAAALAEPLRGLAVAMAEVAALDIADDIEPLFGEDIGRDPELRP